MIARPSRRLGYDPLETQLTQVQFIDKNVDHPDRIVLRDIVFEIFGKQDPCRRSSLSTKRFI
jgi:hypothetical protein